jgi:rhodanese-related sulfurtransferase
MNILFGNEVRTLRGFTRHVARTVVLACCTFAVILSALVAAPATAYDEVLAATYERFYSRFAEKDTAKALQLITVDKVIESMNKGEAPILLDVRTRHEQSILGLTYPHTLHLPMNEVFKPENLAQVPSDRRVIVTCQSGGRCLAISLALRSIGFENVYSMKGGLSELMKALDPKMAFATGEAIPTNAAGAK